MAIERTTSLFHYTPRLEYLKSILRNGFWPRFSLEDLTWLKDPKDLFLAFPMVSFCDIPLHRVAKHTEFYGQYGIGLRQTWAVNNGISPITYISHKAAFRTAISRLTQGFMTKDGTIPDDARVTILSNMKPLRGKIQKGGKWTIKYFYDECEWRFVPNMRRGDQRYLTSDTFHDAASVQSSNQLMQDKYSLSISPDDIKYIFVAKDDEIPDLIHFMESELDTFKVREMKILITRISSFESIIGDF
jgi:hypothetical protein